ncbi:MAG: hypothetical protein K2K93_09450, partial [Muribaculaceae bacterium]|nr:hypothetical protein [Muribaculaceae bacterium]
MKRLLIFLVLASVFGFNALGDEVEIVYNENTDQQYRLTYKTILETPYTVEVIGSHFSGIVDVVEIPEAIELYGKDFAVTKVSESWCHYSGDNPMGPIKIIFPSTVRRITTNGSINEITE